MDQHCNGRGCRQRKRKQTKKCYIETNGNTLRIPHQLASLKMLFTCGFVNCAMKKKHFSVEQHRDRSSSLRGCLNGDKWEKSALSMHAKETHQTQLVDNFDNFTIIAVLKKQKVSPQGAKSTDFIENFRSQ